MTIRKQNPWAISEVPVRRAYPFDSLTRDLCRLLNMPFGMPFDLPMSMRLSANQDWPETWGAMESAFSPRMDLTETDTSIIVSAELPGMSVDDIEVTLSAGTLTIKGEKMRESGSMPDKTIREAGETKTDVAKTAPTDPTEVGDYHTERFFGSFRRTIALPAEVDTEGIAASFENGVLTVTMAKEAARDETLKIDVKAA